jgi:P4 family phage/plasmid primase-like protien
MDGIDKITEEAKERRMKLNPIKMMINDYTENVKEYFKSNPFFYDKNKLYWFWNGNKFKWEIVDEVDLLNSINDAFDFYGLINTGKMRQGYIHSFQSIGRKHIPKEPPKEWIQFKDKIFNIRTREILNVTPEYFFCNPISYEIGGTEETPIMDKLFSDWVGKEYVQSLYEILSYCCYTAYPIQTAICLLGSGRNGKSSFQNILNKFIGMENSCSVDLMKLIKGNFEGAKLFKKLVAFIGETNFQVLSATDNFKKLTGSDIVSVEYKGKDAFDTKNYAKLIIGTNNLPASTDTSEGWFRRWFIIDFPNRFPEGKEIVDIIPEIEYNNLAKKVTRILPELLDRGCFTSQGSIEERQTKYIASSNPITHFFQSCCIQGQEYYVKYTELYSAYFEYLKENKRRTIKSKEFRQLLEEEGVEVDNTTRAEISGRLAVGIGLKENWRDEIKTTKTTKTTRNQGRHIHDRELTEKHDISVVSVVFQKNLILNSPRIFQPCSFCGATFDKGCFELGDGKIVCEVCLEYNQP